MHSASIGMQKLSEPLTNFLWWVLIFITSNFYFHVFSQKCLISGSRLGMSLWIWEGVVEDWRLLRGFWEVLIIITNNFCFHISSQKYFLLSLKNVGNGGLVGDMTLTTRTSLTQTRVTFLSKRFFWVSVWVWVD